MGTFNQGTLTTTPKASDRFTLNDSDPTDIFKFNVTGGLQNINASLTNITPGRDADLRLYRDNGNGVFDAGDTLINSSLKSGNADDAINTKGAPGTYFAQVSRFGSGNVAYDLKLSANAGPSNVVAKETQVGTLSVDRTFSGTINDTNTSDTYAFTLGTFKGVNLRLSGLSADADIRLIRDGNGNGVVDAGEEIRRSSAGGSASELIAGIEQSGNYLVQVYQFGSASTNYQVTFDQYNTTFA